VAVILSSLMFLARPLFNNGLGVLHTFWNFTQGHIFGAQESGESLQMSGVLCVMIICEWRLLSGKAKAKAVS